MYFHPSEPKFHSSEASPPLNSPTITALAVGLFSYRPGTNTSTSPLAEATVCLWKLFPLLKPNVQSLTKNGHEKVQYHSQKTTQHVARQGDSSSKANTVLPVLFDSLCPLWKEKYQGNDSHSSSNYVHPFKITHLTLMPMLGFIWQDLTI